jgi:DNA-binding PadR family transcriptional regulator
MLRPSGSRRILLGIILHVLKEKGSITGYEVCKAIGELTGGVYKPSPGAIYPALRKLELRGLIEKKMIDGKVVYGLTRLGDEYYASHIDEIKTLLEFFRVEASSGKARLFLSLKRIFKIIMAYHDEIDNEKALAISGVLDDARKKIMEIIEG